MNSTPKSLWLILGGIGSLVVAVAHVITIVIGPSAYRFMGAPDLAPLAEQGSPIPSILTAILVVIFSIWGLYAFSGAGIFRKLPFVKIGLFIIGSIYTIRGAAVFLELIWLLMGRLPAPRMAAFSAISLLIGFFYLIGALQLKHVKFSASAP